MSHKKSGYARLCLESLKQLRWLRARDTAGDSVFCGLYRWRLESTEYRLSGTENVRDSNQPTFGHVRVVSRSGAGRRTHLCTGRRSPLATPPRACRRPETCSPAHAEGVDSRAEGVDSRAEGVDSRAEG
eukprot:7060185-Pyramimonas_sp.AAC.2